jgi:hypothetical protein
MQSSQSFQNFFLMQPSKQTFNKTQNSAQVLNLFPLLYTQAVHFPSPYLLHFLNLHFASNLPLPEGRAGTS